VSPTREQKDGWETRPFLFLPFPHIFLSRKPKGPVLSSAPVLRPHL